MCLVSNVPYDDTDSSNADGLCAVAQRIAQLQRNIYGDVFAVQVSCQSAQGEPPRANSPHPLLLAPPPLLAAG